jgi:hypothetical protein
VIFRKPSQEPNLCRDALSNCDGVMREQLKDWRAPRSLSLTQKRPVLQSLQILQGLELLAVLRISP